MTQGQQAIVDADDFEALNVHKWHAERDRTANTFYATRTVEKPHRTTLRMHRVILGATAGQEIDHIDSNGLNNARANLRVASASQNKFNTRLRRTNTSGYKGVSWDRGRGKWHAMICYSGRVKNLGRYFDPIIAAMVYDLNAKRLHGEFACLNFP